MYHPFSVGLSSTAELRLINMAGSKALSFIRWEIVWDGEEDIDGKVGEMMTPSTTGIDGSSLFLSVTRTP